jgi:hypothetical protein
MAQGETCIFACASSEKFIAYSFRHVFKIFKTNEIFGNNYIVEKEPINCLMFLDNDWLITGGQYVGVWEIKEDKLTRIHSFRQPHVPIVGFKMLPSPDSENDLQSVHSPLEKCIFATAENHGIYIFTLSPNPSCLFSFGPHRSSISKLLVGNDKLYVFQKLDDFFPTVYTMNFQDYSFVKNQSSSVIPSPELAKSISCIDPTEKENFSVFGKISECSLTIHVNLFHLLESKSVDILILKRLLGALLLYIENPETKKSFESIGIIEPVQTSIPCIISIGPLSFSLFTTEAWKISEEDSALRQTSILAIFKRIAELMKTQETN